MTPIYLSHALTVVIAHRQADLRRSAMPGYRLRVPRAAVATVFVLLAAVTLIVAKAGSAAAMAPGDFADAHGVYQFDSGELLTLYGVHPMFELDGEVVHLASDGPDRYVADTEPFAELLLERDADGRVSAVSFARPGTPPRAARRVELYDEHQVTFTSEGSRLSGSLLVPSGAGPYPGVAIVHGAEYGTRETYRLLASHLARHGVAALIYDKRGTGASTGDFATATFDDLSADALAAVALLRDHPALDPDRVGLAGMSQGGWIIANAAVQSDEIAFLIALSASGFTPAEQAAWLTGSMLAVRGFDQQVIDTSAKAWAMLYSTLDLIDAGAMEPMPRVPGFWFHALDPHLDAVQLWSQVRQPVLGLWGELDCQVPAYDSMTVLRDALERGPNERYSLAVYAGADHGMALVEPCEREIGMAHGGRHSHPDGYLSAPAAWVHSLERDGAASEVSVPAEVTESRLGWHQSTVTDAPWFGSLIIQMVVLGLLLTGFGAMIAAHLGRAAWSLARRRDVVRPRLPKLGGAVAVTGLLATLLGAGVLAELLALADLRSSPLIGGPSVDGATVLAQLAGMLVVVAVGLGAGAVVAAARARRVWQGPPIGAVAGALFATLLGAWAAYWGLVRLPDLG